MIANSSFSGTYEWHPSVLVDTDADEYDAEMIVWNIERGHCPRCEGPLPHLPEYPAGSRVTACRSIPICGPCGSDEAHQQVDLAMGTGYGLSAASEWPVYVDDINERQARHEQRMQPAILHDGHLLSVEGVTPVINPHNTGGWAQYGGAPAWDRE